jgi:hypothetical protein
MAVYSWALVCFSLMSVGRLTTKSVYVPGDQFAAGRRMTPDQYGG